MISHRPTESREWDQQGFRRGVESDSQGNSCCVISTSAASLPFFQSHFSARLGLVRPAPRSQGVIPIGRNCVVDTVWISAGDDVVEIISLRCERLAFIHRFMPFACCIPSLDTLYDVIAAIDPALFMTRFLAWIEALRDRRYAGECAFPGLKPSA